MTDSEKKTTDNTSDAGKGADKAAATGSDKTTDATAADTASAKDGSVAATAGAAGKPADSRALRRAARAAEKARRAQEKADRARADALAAVRASGFDVRDDDRDRDDATSTSRPASAGDETTSRRGGGDASATGRDGGAVSAADTDADDVREDDTERTGDSALDRRRRDRGAVAAAGSSSSSRPGAASGNGPLAIGLTIAAIVLLCVGVGTGIAATKHSEVRDAEQQQTDGPQTAAAAAREIVTMLFTYSAEDVDQRLDAVEPKLTGKAADEFRSTTRSSVSSFAKSEEVNSYATVAAVGVEKVESPDRVVTLVMVNRMTSTKEQPQAQAMAARVRVTMERFEEDGNEVWRVAEYEVL